MDKSVLVWFLMTPVNGGRGSGPGATASAHVTSNRAATLASTASAIFLLGMTFS
jgi:hypothetical protein